MLTENDDSNWLEWEPPGTFFGGYRLTTYRVTGRARLKLPSGNEVDGLAYDWRQRTLNPSQAEVFREFVALDSAKKGAAEELFKFAQRYGALGLCRHGFPFTHPRLTHLGELGFFPLPGRPEYCSPFGLKPERGVMFESLAGWWAWIDLARLILRVATQLRKVKLSSEDRARLIAPGPPFNGLFESIKVPEPERLAPRRLIAVLLNVWLGFSRVGLRCYSWRSKFALHPVADLSLHGLIGLQLALHVCQAKSVALCSACGRLAFPDRITKGRNTFCEECRDRGRWLLSTQKRRASAVVTPTNGGSVGDITARRRAGLEVTPAGGQDGRDDSQQNPHGGNDNGSREPSPAETLAMPKVKGQRIQKYDPVKAVDRALESIDNMTENLEEFAKKLPATSFPALWRLRVHRSIKRLRPLVNRFSGGASRHRRIVAARRPMNPPACRRSSPPLI